MKETCTFFHQDVATAHAPNGPVCPVSYLHQFSFQIFSASTVPYALIFSVIYFLLLS